MKLTVLEFVSVDGVSQGPGAGYLGGHAQRRVEILSSSRPGPGDFRVLLPHQVRASFRRDLMAEV